MNARTTSTLIIVGTLLIGILIGSLATAALLNQRVDTLVALRQDGGPLWLLMDAIEPTDAAQRERITVILRSATQEQRVLRETTLNEHRALIREVQQELNRVLTAEQKTALKQRLERQAQQARQGPPFGQRPPRRGFPPEIDSTRAKRFKAWQRERRIRLEVRRRNAEQGGQGKQGEDDVQREVIIIPRDSL